MTKAHPHRQVNVHLDTVDDADVIERIEAQPSMVSYVRELVRRDIHDERLECAALKASELQTENAKLRELVAKMARALGVNSEWCDRDCEREFDCNWLDVCPLNQALLTLGIEVDS